MRRSRRRTRSWRSCRCRARSAARAAQALKVSVAFPEREPKSTERHQRGCFGRRGNTGIDHAGHYHAEQEQHGPDHRSIRLFRQRNQQGPDEEPQARNQTVAMMVIVTRMPGMTPPTNSAPMFTSASRPGVDKRDRRRDQHRQRARNRDHAGCHFRLVALLQHGGEAGGRWVAAEAVLVRRCTNPRAGERGRHPETAGNPAHPGRRCLEQIVSNAADQDDSAITIRIGMSS